MGVAEENAIILKGQYSVVHHWNTYLSFFLLNPKEVTEVNVGTKYTLAKGVDWETVSFDESKANTF